MQKLYSTFNFITIKLKTLLKNGLILFLILLFLLFSTFLLILNYYFRNRIYPQISVLSLNLGGKTKKEAIIFLSENISPPGKIQISSNKKNFDLSLPDISFKYEYDKTVETAFNYYRKNNFRFNFLKPFIFLFKKHNLEIEYSYDKQKLDEFIEVVSNDILSEPIYPSVNLIDGKIIVNKGTPGETLDKEIFLDEFEKKIKNINYSKMYLPLKKIDPTLSQKDSEIFEKRAKKFLNKTLILKNDFFNLTLDDKSILGFLDYYEQYSLDKIKDFVIVEISPQLERPPQNAVFRFENGKVTEFTPARDGIKIEINNFLDKIIDSLSELENTENNSIIIEIPIIKAPPEITLNEVNNLGIRELLGRGSSKFKGSIESRVHNISLASSKFNGVLVPPGETLSFNKTLGDVSSFTGYKKAYIIKDGKTILGDGGGVCQVSTTLFRAVLSAGLPIIERSPHSYRVYYYEQDSSPGMDATVFDPTTDFKFKNDTPGYILIQTFVDAKNYSLTIEIYGTPDGRKTTITKPEILSSSPPPDDLYIDDPSLPAGVIKQIEHKAYGAKVRFIYKVERDGEIIINQEFISTYRPWQAVFLKGVGNTN